MVATGVALGCTLSVKYVGAFVTLTVGAQAAGQLWHRYCDTANSLVRGEAAPGTRRWRWRVWSRRLFTNKACGFEDGAQHKWIGYGLD